MKKSLIAMCCLLSLTAAAQENAEVSVSNRYTSVVADNTKVYPSKRPPLEERLFIVLEALCFALLCGGFAVEPEKPVVSLVYDLIES